MPAFDYRAVDPRGRRLRGRAEAASSAALFRSLADQGVVVVEVQEASTAPSGFGRRTVGRREVLEATGALAALLSAGLPLVRALDTAAGVAGGRLAALLHEVRAGVVRGESLAAALAAYPTVFPPYFVGMVRAGERSGDLAGSFHRLAEQLEREQRFRSRLLSASIYPLLLALLGGVALVILMLFVLPRFVTLLADAGAVLPRSTRIMMEISEALQRFWPALLLIPAGVAAGILLSRATAPGRRAAATLLLRMPGIGHLRRDVLAARFARLVGVLLGGGAPLLSALGDAVQSVADPRAAEEVARVRASVREGSSLHAALRDSEVFPPLLAQLAEVGEESSRLQEFLLRAAGIFEDRTEQSMQRLVTLAEPLTILVFGGIVGFVALSLLQAIYSVNAEAFR